jgi:hypothetical protein
VSRDARTSQYNSLEYLLHSDKVEFSPILFLIALFSGPIFDLPHSNAKASWGPTVHDIVRRARLRRGEIKYTMITNLARELLETFNVGGVTPPEWTFPWSTAQEARTYFASLQALSAYNLLAVHFGAERHKLKGGGLDQICWFATSRRLLEDINRISNLPLAVVSDITAALTFGHRTRTPTPRCSQSFQSEKITSSCREVWSFLKLVSKHAKPAHAGFTKHFRRK